MISYALVTPARNEEAYLEAVVQSVISQRIPPKKWIIVSDGSTDRTDEIARKYAAQYDWIEVVRMAEHRDRNFAAKVSCFNAGYEHLKGIEYDVIGNLDADITFDEDYFAFLLAKFAENLRLGVAGTPFVEEGYSSADDSYEGGDHVAGGCQLFRRECFEEIGGYPSVKAGSVDKIAVVTARMMGWETKSFREKKFFHHRKLGTGGSSTWMAAFSYGKRDFRMGRHPLWESFRVVYRMTKKPYFIEGALLMAGYVWAAVRREERPVSRDFVAFVQKEQMARLRMILKSALRLEKLRLYS
jgi:glycosyltransferase involved in cell wall biosynthesis